MPAQASGNVKELCFIFDNHDERRRTEKLLFKRSVIQKHAARRASIYRFGAAGKKNFDIGVCGKLTDAVFKSPVNFAVEHGVHLYFTNFFRQCLLKISRFSRALNK